MPQYTQYTRREYHILINGVVLGVLFANFVSAFFGSIGLAVAWWISILTLFISAFTNVRWK